MVYLDVNVFIYFADENSNFYPEAEKLIELIGLVKIKSSTSLETLQEIVHSAKKLKQTKRGVSICQDIIKLIPTLYPVNLEVIRKYLYMAGKFPGLESRDCIHLATCLVNKVKTLVTEDRKLLKVKAEGLNICTIKQALINLGI